MSIDLAVWSERKFDLPHQLPSPAQWKAYEEEWAFEGEGWHVLVHPVQDEPDSAVIARLPKAKFVAYVTLEPIDSDRAAYRVLENAVRSLAKASGGVWVDPLGSVYAHAEGAFE